jgi:hypothetical protein
MFAHSVCDPSAIAPPLVDWLIDHGVPDVIAWEAVLRGPLFYLDVWAFVSRIGSGIGSGIGIGRGSGSGSGSGIGRGIGSGNLEQYEVKQMEPGMAYLVHCGDWHTFIGRVVRQVGPQTYLMDYVSKISETNNGDCWQALAAGNQRLRKAASYVHSVDAETGNRARMVLPLTIAAFEWVGKLPMEE